MCLWTKHLLSTDGAVVFFAILGQNGKMSYIQLTIAANYKVLQSATETFISLHNKIQLTNLGVIY